MKAKQLIERLKDIPEDMEVCTEGQQGPLSIKELIIINNFDYNILLIINN
jgi:hypothetical protein